MALFLATIMKWQTCKSQGNKRVRDATNGTEYLLNTNRLDSIRAHGSGGTESSCFYFDDPFNSRDQGCYMELVKTPAQLITLIDTSQNKYVTLPIHPDNDSQQLSVKRTFQSKDIAFAVDQYTGAETSWVTYCDEAFKKRTVLVGLSVAQIIALM